MLTPFQDKNTASCIQSAVIYHYYYLDAKDYKENYDKSGYVFGIYYPEYQSLKSKTLQRSSGADNKLKLIMKIQARVQKCFFKNRFQDRNTQNICTQI